MRTKDQFLLEQAYNQIMLDKQLHQLFLTEAGLLDKAKQFGGTIVDKAKGARLCWYNKKTKPPQMTLGRLCDLQELSSFLRAGLQHDLHLYPFVWHKQ